MRDKRHTENACMPYLMGDLVNYRGKYWATLQIVANLTFRVLLDLLMY